MKNNCLRMRFVLSAVSGLLLIAGIVIFWQKSAIAESKSAKPGVADQSDFVTETAVLARDEGTPIGPPKKFIICFRDHSIRVAEKAVQSFLNRGAYLGPCTNGVGDVVVCRHGHTLIIRNGTERAGDKLGPCSNMVFMCNLHLHTIAVKADDIAKHFAKGHHLGICPGKTMICHKGHTIIVADAALPAHLGHGDCIGYCLGAQGPLLDGVSHCATNPPVAAASQ
jgi:hypothetical protein